MLPPCLGKWSIALACVLKVQLPEAKGSTRAQLTPRSYSISDHAICASKTVIKRPGDQIIAVGMPIDVSGVPRCGETNDVGKQHASERSASAVWSHKQILEIDMRYKGPGALVQTYVGKAADLIVRGGNKPLQAVFRIQKPLPGAVRNSLRYSCPIEATVALPELRPLLLVGC